MTTVCRHKNLNACLWLGKHLLSNSLHEFCASFEHIFFRCSFEKRESNLVSKDSRRTKDGEEYSLRKDWDFFNDDGGDFCWPPPPPPPPEAEGIGAVPLSASPSVISKF